MGDNTGPSRVLLCLLDRRFCTDPRELPMLKNLDLTTFPYNWGNP